jgi:hypothetical protein
LLLQILLTLGLYISLAAAKSKAVALGQVDEARRALYEDAWPDSVQKINNNIRNQFEVPILFYVVVIVLWQLGDIGLLVQALAWLFVVSRFMHAFIHTGSNIVLIRRRVFSFGTLIVFVMAIVAVFRVLNQIF